MRLALSNKSEIGIITLVLIASAIIIFFIPKVIESGTASGTYPMNMSISKSIGLTLSNVLAQNITFVNESCAVTNTPTCGINSAVGAVNNATWNNVTAPGGAGFNGTFYNITNAGNTYEDICQMANAQLTCFGAQACVGEKILMGNVSWENGTTKNAPTAPGLNKWTLAYNTANLTAGRLASAATIHLRFYLRVPASVTPGIYNTSYTICAVEASSGCTC